MNQKNSLGLNSCFMDLDDPLELFKIWMAEAEKKEIRDPTSTSLATANKAGQPNVRMVLLKGLSPRGFVFYTNLNSSKSHDLKENPKAAMCFHWKSFNRQIRILGSVTQVDDKEANLYFNSRSYESKISAWASEQSNTMKNLVINDINFLSAKIGIDKWHDDSFYFNYKYVLGHEAIPLLSHNILKIIISIIGKSKKCLVVDFDDTIWGGIIGEVGSSGIEIGNNSPLGEIFLRFQKYIF